MGREYWKSGNMLYPVPAVMVSCREKGGKTNIVTIAWTGTICSDPAMLYISVRPERYSYDIIKNTGEFVVNLPSEKLVKELDYCGVKSGRDTDKLQELGLTEIESKTVSVPSIAECPVCIECKVKNIIPLGSHDMFIAEVSAVSVDESFIDEKGKFHLEEAGLLAYSHGEYFSLGEKLGSFGYSVRKKQ